MRIALVGYNPGKIGGIEAFSRTLKKDILTDIEFVYEYAETGAFEVNDCIAVAKYNVVNRALNRVTDGNYTKNKIKKILNQRNYDLYIINSPKYLDVSPNLSKTILIQHTTVENWWDSKYNFNKSEELLELARRVGKLVALSEMEATAIAEKLDINKHRIEVINFAAGIPFLEQEKQPGKNLVMLARFQNEIKRIDLVIKAMKLLPEYTLNVYGDGKDREYLVQLAREYQNVHIHPSTTEKMKVLDENNIYILSSEFEGYPVSVIEAISRKLPVVARNTFYSAPELIKDNGVLLGKEWSETEFQNAIIKCNEHYSEYSKNAAKYFYKYDLNNIKDKWLHLVQDLKHA